MRDAAVTEEIIESLSRESGVGVPTVRKFFERGTCACSVATNRAICDAAERLCIPLELVDEAPTEK